MTSSPRHPGRFLPGIIGLTIMLVLVLLVSGCTQPAAEPPAPTQISVATPAPTDMTTTMAEGGKKMVTFTEADKGKTGEIAQTTRFAVQLAENPTTGFQWNATLSPGLELQSSDYRMNDAAPGMVGVGGTRTWIIIAKDLGTQKFSASYLRSWETVTGNETAYSVKINVVRIVTVQLPPNNVTSNPAQPESSSDMANQITMQVIMVDENANAEYTTVWLTPSQRIYTLAKNIPDYKIYIGLMEKSKKDGSLLTFTLATDDPSVIKSIVTVQLPPK
ncbi:MAG: protease inhibitor I42 family protein [Methanoregula sp.]|nr:protease inhibitor I42 family protein [Methanoregula sp.]